MQSRRQFLARTGAAGAAVLAPQALMSGLASAKAAPLLKSGRFAEGVASGDPGPHGDHAVDPHRGAGAQGQRAARGRARQAASGTSSRATSSARAPAKGGSVKARVTGLKAHEQYFYRFETKDGSSAGRPLPDRPAGRTPRAAHVRLLLLPGLHARLLQRARA